MPTYVYECPSCGEFEVEQRLTEDALSKCVCGEPVKRIITHCRLMIAETQKAAYFAGREGDERLAAQMEHNAHVAAGIKRGEFDMPNQGANQPREMYNDLERRLKE